MAKKIFPQNWVRYYRTKKKISAEKLGAAIGMSKEGVTKIERFEGGLSIEVARKIADELGIHYASLYDGPDGILATKTPAEQKMLESFRRVPGKMKEKLIQTAELWAFDDTDQQGKKS